MVRSRSSIHNVSRARSLVKARFSQAWKKSKQNKQIGICAGKELRQWQCQTRVFSLVVCC
jgi:hypothetical protein